MNEVWLYSTSGTRGEDLAADLAELGYTPRLARLGRDLVPPAAGTASRRAPRLVAVVVGEDEDIREDLVREVMASTPLADTPLLVSLHARHLREASRLAIDAELLVRPFTVDELRIRAARAARRPGASGGLDRTVLGRIELNEAAYSATVGGTPVSLTPMEFELLAFLARNAGRVFSREALLARVWGYSYYGGARTVDVHVRRLRAKLGERSGAVIRTVRRVGYTIELQRAAAAAPSARRVPLLELRPLASGAPV